MRTKAVYYNWAKKSGPRIGPKDQVGATMIHFLRNFSKGMYFEHYAILLTGLLNSDWSKVITCPLLSIRRKRSNSSRQEAGVLLLRHQSDNCRTLALNSSWYPPVAPLLNTMATSLECTTKVMKRRRAAASTSRCTTENTESAAPVNCSVYEAFGQWQTMVMCFWKPPHPVLAL